MEFCRDASQYKVHLISANLATTAKRKEESHNWGLGHMPSVPVRREGGSQTGRKTFIKNKIIP